MSLKTENTLLEKPQGEVKLTPLAFLGWSRQSVVNFDDTEIF